MTSNTWAAAVAIGPALTAAERDQALLYLQQARTGFAGAIRGVSEKQWKFKPSPERWSLAEIADHVVFVQERVLGPVRDQLAEAPPPPANVDSAQIDQLVLSRFPSRLLKFPSPVQPTGGLSVSEALDRADKNHARLAEFLELTPDLRRHALEAPPLKLVTGGAHELMDGYQWILAVAAHTERHTKQILEVRADAGFPAD